MPANEVPISVTFALIVPILEIRPVAPPKLYCIHNVPENVDPTVLVGRLQLNATLADCEGGSVRLVEEKDVGCAEVLEHPRPVTVMAEPLAVCPIEVNRRPLLAKRGVPHIYPTVPTHAAPPPPVGLRENKPRDHKDASTMEIIRIAQPYVIRYSIADCALALGLMVCIFIILCTVILTLLLISYL